MIACGSTLLTRLRSRIRSVGSFAAYLAGYDGGLKALVRDERAARRADMPARPDKRQTARDTMKCATALDPLAVATDNDGLAVVVARREADGTLAIVGALPEGSDLGQRVILAEARRAAYERELEGAVHMGLGGALSEEFVVKGGIPVTDTLKSLGIVPPAGMLYTGPVVPVPTLETLHAVASGGVLTFGVLLIVAAVAVAAVPFQDGCTVCAAYVVMYAGIAKDSPALFSVAAGTTPPVVVDVKPDPTMLPEA